MRGLVGGPAPPDLLAGVPTMTGAVRSHSLTEETLHPACRHASRLLACLAHLFDLAVDYFTVI